MTNDITERIDINRADAAELTQLPGIAENLAQRIVEYRTTVHPFEEVIELAAVPGISERMVRLFEHQVSVIPLDEIDKANASLAKIADAPTPDVTPLLEASSGVQPTTEMAETLATEATDDHVEPAASLDDSADDSAPAAGQDEPEAIAPIESEPAPVTDNTELVESEPDPMPDEAEFIEAESEEDSIVESIQLVEPEPVVETAVSEPEPDPDPEPIPRPVITRSISQAPEPAPVMAPPPSGQQGVGTGFWIFGVVLGTLFGAILSLGLLYSLNGGLRFAEADNEIRSEVVTLGQTQTELSNSLQTQGSQLNELTESDAGVATRVAGLNAQQTETAASMSALGANTADLQERLQTAESALESAQETVAVLEERATEMDQRLATVAESSEKFDQFLDTLRDLLFDLQGAPSPQMTLTPVITGTPESNGTPIPGINPTATAVPTRTPRPTATPFITATPVETVTVTPESQP